MKKVFICLILLLFLGFGCKKEIKTNNTTQVETKENLTTITTPENKIENEVKKNVETEIPPSVSSTAQESFSFHNTDSDGDGLNNYEEEQLKTNPEKKDTDSDGLSDSEEVKIWSTDPTQTDTDKDTYIDGIEVQSGYNPNGQGPLKKYIPPPTLSVDLPADPDFDKYQIPKNSDGTYTLIEDNKSGISLKIDPTKRDPVVSYGTCLQIITDCVKKEGPEKIDACIINTPTCKNSEPWKEDEKCCPALCISNYEKLREKGAESEPSFLKTFIEDTRGVDSCFPQVSSIYKN